jgi:hypothetical protein
MQADAFGTTWSLRQGHVFPGIRGQRMKKLRARSAGLRKPLRNTVPSGLFTVVGTRNRVGAQFPEVGF